MNQTVSKVHLHMSGALVSKRGAVTIGADAKIGFSDLDAIGVGLRAMDSALTGPATASGAMLQHMLQTWLPGTLRVVTQVRNIDEIAGVTTVGRWEDELISLRIAEPAARAELYGDTTNVPLASYRQDIESRSVVRFEQGFQTGRLEDARQSAIGYQAADEKRNAAIESLDISRNQVGFYGMNFAGSNTYGLLNEPSLPAYVSTGTAWLTATFDELVAEFNRLYNQLETQMGGQLQDSARLCLVMPTGYRSIFSVYSKAGSGMTFRQWLNENFPSLRVVSTNEFKGANGDLDVAYLFIENAGIQDDSDANNASMIQAVPVRYQVLGSENRIKGYLEDATNATAGIFILRPWAFARMTISA